MYIICEQTIVTPLTQKLLHWDELENSILFCGAGVEVCAALLLNENMLLFCIYCI